MVQTQRQQPKIYKQSKFPAFFSPIQEKRSSLITPRPILLATKKIPNETQTKLHKTVTIGFVFALHSKGPITASCRVFSLFTTQVAWGSKYEISEAVHYSSLEARKQSEAQNLQEEAQQRQQQQHQEAVQRHQEALQQHQEAQRQHQEALQQHHQQLQQQTHQLHQQQLQQLHNNHQQQILQHHQQQQQQHQLSLAQPPPLAQKGRMPRAKADARPRGRMTAYAFFVQTCREEHKKKHPEENVVFAEFSKKCAERWKTMLDKEKKRFHEMAEGDKKRFDTEMLSYTPPKGEKQRGKKRKQVKDPNAPKRSLSAFFWFSNDERSKVKAANPEYGVGDIAKELGRRWADCDPEDKSRYEALADQDKARYEKEMTAYKKKNNPAMQQAAVPVPEPEEPEEDEEEVDDDEDD